MAGRTLTVYLAADTTKFRTGMAGAAGSMSGLDAGIGGLSSKLTNMLGPALIGAGAAAGAYAIKLGVEGVQAAIADEAAAAKLATTLNNLGLAHDTTEVEAMIDALQRETGVADEVLRPAFGRLVTSLGSTKLATDALKLAMDVSAGTGKSLDTVVAALAKAYDGNTGALGRLGAGLDTQILKTGNMDLITQALATTFSGQAEQAANTYQGSINRLSVGFDELKESFGSGFLDGLGQADAKTGDLTTTMSNLEPAINDVGATVGETLAAIADITTAISDARIAFNDFKDDLGPFEAVIDSAATAVYRMATPLLSVANAANSAAAAFDALKAAAANSPVGKLVNGVLQ